MKNRLWSRPQPSGQESRTPTPPLLSGGYFIYRKKIAKGRQKNFYAIACVPSAFMDNFGRLPFGEFVIERVPIFPICPCLWLSKPTIALLKLFQYYEC